MATPANHNRETSQPTCHNCSTSTTPLWRRDEFGAVLCNACGLFLKLHNRPRPISLKTDVIKSRNRVKNAGMRPDLSKKKQVQPQPFPNPTDPNGLDVQSTAAAATAQAARRKSANGSGSPISRTGTPSLYTATGIPGFPSIQDPSLATSLAAYGSAGRAPSPLNGDRRDSTPPSTEQLLATNSSLHTRVGELELINKLYSDRVQQLELSDANAKHEQELSRHEVAQLRADLEAITKAEAQLREQLDDSHRRENSLKRRLDELEVELEAKTAAIAAASVAATAAAATAIVTDGTPPKSPEPELEPQPEPEPEPEVRDSPPAKKAKLSDEPTTEEPES
ncbi:hypothetical protein SAPIO_CDS7346 [Scedosporium apiospermum]|uniref:GATA-type domain-containing protein n=1 Tax=Pseudallescheria apiosperma TaxID=563466 RepID=A0A084G1P4_PSEDA|nr:uncharacterized protein SAPIO_CDS7346 [Scedosporium apiospermum]KEZ41256.1 hypothetical protein SAPIO_CDS7346 [Scedosporium apiospermum]